MIPIKYKNNTIYLNERLIKNKKIESNNLERLKVLYLRKMVIFELIKLTDNKAKLKNYGKRLTLIEFEIQKLWKFKPNINYHKFWKTPKCTCPKIDNEERWGTKYTIINSDCPIHA